MEKKYFILVFLLKSIAIYSQHYFNLIVPTDTNCIDGIYTPTIEYNENSIHSFTQTIFLSNYGGKESILNLSNKGIILSNLIFLDSIEYTISFDLNRNEKSIFACGTKFKYYDTINVFWFAKLNSNFDTIWTNSLKTNYNRCHFQKIRELKNGNLALCGIDDNKKRNSQASITAKGIITITDSLGVILNYIEIEDPNPNYLLGLFGLTEDAFGNIYSCGIVKKNNFNNDVIIVKVNPQGKLLWKKQIPSNDFSDGAFNVFMQSNGSVLLIGDSYNPDFFGEQFCYTLLINLNPDGLVNWTKRIIKIYNGEIRYCVPDASNNYICSGTIITEPNRKADGYLIKVSAAGDSLWSRVINHSEKSHEQFFNISQASDGGYYLTGYSWIEGINTSKAWIVKVDSFGCLVPGCQNVVSTKDIIEGKVKPFSFYPNPVKDVFYFLSRIDASSNYAIHILNLQGLEVYKNEFVPTAGKQYIFNLENSFAPGQYIIQIQNEKGQIIQSEKMEII